MAVGPQSRLGWPLGCLAVSAIAQDDPCALQLCLDADPFDVAFEADGVAIQLVLDFEQLANLPEQFVVSEPVSHLVGGRPMSIGAEDGAQPS